MGFLRAGRGGSSSLVSSLGGRARTSCRPRFCSRLRRFCTRRMSTLLWPGFAVSLRPGLGANRPYRPKRELRFSAGLFLLAVNVIGAGFGASGVSSLSACSGEERFSGPEEKSTSSGLRGVVNEGAR